MGVCGAKASPTVAAEPDGSPVIEPGKETMRKRPGSGAHTISGSTGNRSESERPRTQLSMEFNHGSWPTGFGSPSPGNAAHTTAVVPGSATAVGPGSATPPGIPDTDSLRQPEDASVPSPAQDPILVAHGQHSPAEAGGRRATLSRTPRERALLVARPPLLLSALYSADKNKRVRSGYKSRRPQGPRRRWKGGLLPRPSAFGKQTAAKEMYPMWLISVPGTATFFHGIVLHVLVLVHVPHTADTN